jgi:hypothetical protein
MEHNTYLVVFNNGFDFKVNAFNIKEAYARAIIYLHDHNRSTDIHHIIEGRNFYTKFNLTYES